MKKALVRLWRFSRTPDGLKVVRYTMVSVISAATSLVILTIVFGVLRLWSEVVSTLFANIMAGIPSYYLNRRWVWRKGGRSHIWRELLPFWVMSHYRHRLRSVYLDAGAALCQRAPSAAPGPHGARRWGKRCRIRNFVDSEVPDTQSAVR